jgi:hypothetical protein
MRESKELLWENAIIPMMRRFISHLNTDLLPLFDNSEGLELGMDLALIPDLSIKQERIWDRIKKAGHLTIDEKRKMTGFEPLPDGTGNTILVSSGDMPYDLMRAGVTAGNLNELVSSGATGNEAPTDENVVKSSKKNYLKKANGLSNEDYLDKLDEMTRGFDSELKKELEKVFSEFGQKLEEGFNRGEEVAVAIALILLQDRLATVYKPTLKATIDTFVKFALDDIGDFIVNEGDFSRRVETFLEQELFNRAEYVSKTTQKIVTNKVSKGREEGLSKEEIASSLNEEVQDENRMGMISEGEVTGAREFALYEVANRASKHYHKTWLTVGDELVRVDHASANGQTVPSEEMFDVGGEAMDHPSDSTASAKNTVYCRCSMRLIPSSEINS